MNEPGGIGYDKARVDALEDQVAVDTAIIKSLRTEGGVLRAKLTLIKGGAEAELMRSNDKPAWDFVHWVIDQVGEYPVSGTQSDA